MTIKTRLTALENKQDPGDQRTETEIERDTELLKADIRARLDRLAAQLEKERQAKNDGQNAN